MQEILTNLPCLKHTKFFLGRLPGHVKSFVFFDAVDGLYLYYKYSEEQAYLYAGI